MSSDLSTFVEANTTISNASSPTVQSLDVGLFACFHTNYAARVKLYDTSSVLEDLVTDGFSIDSPAWKAANVYAAAPNAPAQFAIGRRALPFTQILNLTCTDGTVGDAYAFNIVSPLGKISAISYENVINPGVGLAGGSALTGNVTLVPGSEAVVFASAQTLTAGEVLTFSTQTGVAYTVSAATSTSTAAVLTAPYTGTATSTATATPAETTSVTNGSTAVTFAAAQSLAKGTLLMFASQPGTYYALSLAVVASASGTLTAAYQGTTNAATPTTTLAVLAGTFDAIQGSPLVVSTASQVAALAPGDSVQFVSQIGSTYTVLSVTSTVVTLTQPYTGATSGTINASAVCQVSTAATNIAYQLGLLSNVGTIAVVNSPTPAFPTVVEITQVAGLLNDIQGWRQGGFTGVNPYGVGGTLLVQDVTADPGIASDLAAMVAANALAFFGIMLDSNSAAEVEAAASFIEGQGGSKFGFFNNSDYGNCSTTVTTDLFSELKNLSLKQSFVQQNNQQVLCYAGSAACGQLLAMNPGSYSATYKALPLVPADNDATLTANERSAINTMSASDPGVGGKNGNYYVNADNVFTMWPGCAPGGQFIDLSIGVDALNPAVQAAMVVALGSLPKVPLDKFGMGLLGDAITGVLNLYASPQYNFLLPSGADATRPIVVTVPDVKDLTPAQRATRNVSGITWSAGLQGAIDTATVNGVLLP